MNVPVQHVHTRQMCGIRRLTEIVGAWLLLGKSASDFRLLSKQQLSWVPGEQSLSTVLNREAVSLLSLPNATQEGWPF